MARRWLENKPNLGSNTSLIHLPCRLHGGSVRLLLSSLFFSLHSARMYADALNKANGQVRSPWCRLKSPSWCGLDVQKHWMKTGRVYWGCRVPWINLFLVSKYKFKEDHNRHGLTLLGTMSKCLLLVFTIAWQQVMQTWWRLIQCVHHIGDFERSKRRVVGARWGSGLSVSAADLLGFISMSWLDEKALLMSGVWGQNGQFGDHRKATGTSGYSQRLQGQLWSSFL